MNILYSLHHLGYTIPPQADAGWIGKRGRDPPPRRRLGRPERLHGSQHDLHEWNLLHVGRLLKEAGGLPAHGNQRSLWDAGCRFDFPNPEYR